MESQIDLLQRAWNIQDYVEVPQTLWIEFSEFNTWSKERQADERENIVLVIDGATWAISSLPLENKSNRAASSVYSGNGTGIGLYNHQRAFSMYTVEVGEEGEVPKLHSYTHEIVYNNSNIRERRRMAANENQMSPDELKALAEGETGSDVGNLEALLLNAAEGASKEAGVASGMTASAGFTGESVGSTNVPATSTPGAKSLTEADLLNESIKTFAEKARTKSANQDNLHIFNRTWGTHLGYLTTEDSKVEASLKPVPRVRPDGTKELEDTGVPSDILALHQQGKTVKATYYKKDFKLTWKEAAPGKIEALFFTIPLGGYVDFDLFSKDEEIIPNKSETTLQTLAMSYKQALFFLPLYYGQGIKEDPRTHGAYASILEVKGKTVRKTDKKTKAVTPTTFKRLAPQSKRRVLTLPGNYLPIKTFKTIALAPTKMTEEQLKEVNFSLFYHLKDAKTKSDVQKISNLVPSDRKLINFDDPTNIKSVFVTADNGTRETPKIRPYYGGEDQTIPVPEIPIKELHTAAKEGSVPKPRYVKIDIFDKNVAASAELQALSSLQLAKFAPFRAILGDEFTKVDFLRSLVTTKKESKQIIDARVISQMELAMMSGNAQEISGLDAGMLQLSQEELLQQRRDLYELKSQISRSRATK